MRKLYFTQIVDFRFIDNGVQDKLNYAWKELQHRKNKIEFALADLPLVSCSTSNTYNVYDKDSNNVCQLRQDYVISKANNKTKWNDIYKIINNVKAVRYTLK